MIRKFYLENEQGKMYYFDYRHQTLISQVSGIGFSLDFKYLEYSHFYAKVKYNMPLSEINETLIFLNGYKGYKTFVDYISKSSNELKLHYENTAFKAYCYVDVKSLSKADLVGGTIQSNIIFKKLSLWLKEKTYIINANGIAKGKVYPYTYPYQYLSSFEGKINVVNNGLDKAPLIIKISGDVDNPQLLVKKNDEVLSSLRLYLSETNCVININAMPSKQEMSLTTNEVTTDIYKFQDFKQDNFIFLDNGNYELEFKPGVSTNALCKITVVEGYLGI